MKEILKNEKFKFVHVDGPIFRLDTCGKDGNVVSSWMYSVPCGGVNLDNAIMGNIMPMPEGGSSDMAKYKFNQYVMIDDKKCWVTANTAQEFADKVLKLSMNNNKDKHDFKAYANNWYEVFCKPNIEIATQTTYERQLQKYIFPALGTMYIEDITVDDCQRLFNGMSGRKSTKNKVREVLTQIFDAAVEDKLIAFNPLKSKRFKITGEESRKTVPYDVKQIQYLVKHIDDVKNPTDRFFVAMLCFHPLRLEEILGIKYGDIDRKKCEVNICRAVTHPTRNQPEIKETKTEKSTRIAPLSQRVRSYMPKGKPDEFVFGGEKALSYTQVVRMCERIQRDTGFSEKITPRRFRCTLLTDIYDQTRDVKLTQDAGGHATPDITFKNYVRGREISRDAIKALEKLYA